MLKLQFKSKKRVCVLLRLIGKTTRVDDLIGTLTQAIIVAADIL